MSVSDQETQKAQARLLLYLFGSPVCCCSVLLRFFAAMNVAGECAEGGEKGGGGLDAGIPTHLAHLAFALLLR